MGNARGGKGNDRPFSADDDGEGGNVLPGNLNVSSSENVKVIDVTLKVGGTIDDIFIVCENKLILGCIVQCLRIYNASASVVGCSSLSQLDLQNGGRAPLVMLCGLGAEATHRVIDQDLPLVLERFPLAKVVIISDVESPLQIGRSLELGAKGFIGMSSTFEIVLAAIRLVWAGGIFIPASSIGGTNMASAAPQEAKLQLVGLTPRQIEIVKCLRRGERNMDIAKKFGLKESTVSVHIRNIMEKLKVKSRMEIIYLTKGMFED
ncbi:response regulator transcription factor [Labrys sp. LIt4]|nr:response regulator transcription factor [Labrys sp. LIt4]MBP0582749.1 response regulator transcription factor [Labrys sp. LIt4]